MKRLPGTSASWILLAAVLIACSSAGDPTLPAIDGGIDTGPDADVGPATMDADNVPDVPPSDAGRPPEDAGACTETCDAPPSVCFEPIGTCETGTCQYAVQDGVACDDGDPASEGDVCTAGVCAGVVGAADSGTFALGSGHTCAIADGAVRCWGSNSNGELGDGGVGDGLTPVTVIGIDDAVEIRSYSYETCVRRATGEVECWGGNGFGQLGDGTRDSRNSPVRVVGLSDAVQIAIGVIHTCARRATGGVVCWGNNDFDQLGGASTARFELTPVAVPGLSDALDLVAGANHTCARRATGDVVCWGSNRLGQLGNGMRMDEPIGLVTVMDLANVTQVSAGLAHTCALVAERVHCWGSNEHGQLGDEMNHLVPMPVATAADVLQIASGPEHQCAVLVTGAIDCWGKGWSGRLGDGDESRRLLPVMVLGLSDAVAVQAGSAHTCALQAAGTMSCWGSNFNGELGDGTWRNSSSVPVVATHY